MRKLRGFTLIELLVVIAIIALLIGILVPALGAAKKAANKMKNGTQVRGICNALVLWSASQTTTDQFPGAGIGNCIDNTVINRFGALCTVTTGDPLSPKLLINPAGTDVLAASASNLLTTNISYALLDTGNPEWKNGVNAGAPIVCDKQVPSGANASYWNTSAWQGNVGWGDVHTTFETSSSVSTMIAGVSISADALFGGAAATDAVMDNPGS